MGGSWRTPVYMGLLDRGFVNDLKADGTFNEISFNREWTTIMLSLNTINCWNILRDFEATA